MHILITGSPGTGKTTLAQDIAKKLKYEYLNEKSFALSSGIGRYDEKENELVIDVKVLQKKLSSFLKKKKNILLEGHILCETKIPLDLVIILKVEPEILLMRLEARNYSPLKIQDNVFCEGIDYCKKHALRNYSKEKIIEIDNSKDLSRTKEKIIYEIHRISSGN